MARVKTGGYDYLKLTMGATYERFAVSSSHPIPGARTRHVFCVDSNEDRPKHGRLVRLTSRGVPDKRSPSWAGSLRNDEWREVPAPRKRGRR